MAATAFLAFSSLLLLLPAGALEPDRLPSQYFITAWQEELPQNSVQAIAQDRDGYLWLGTQDGIARFDGVRFDSFDEQSTPTLTSSDTRTLLADRHGRLWIGSRGGGLYLRREGRIEPVVTDAIPKDEVIYTLLETRAGEIWVGTRTRGALRLRNGDWEPYGPSAGLPSSTVLSLFEDRQGVLWAGTHRGGLSRFVAGRFETLASVETGGQSIVALTEDRAGNLWIGTSGAGLHRLGPERSGPSQLVPGTEGMTPRALLEDRDGGLWAGTLGAGLLRVQPGRLDRLDRPGGLPSSAVLCLHEDREGNLWVGTEGGGVVRIRDASFRTFGPPEGMRGRNSRAVLEDRRGAIWVATEDGGLSRIERDRVANWTKADGLPSDAVISLFEDGAGTLWIGTLDFGLSRRDDSGFRSVLGRKNQSRDTVMAMAEDHGGRLWAATLSGLQSIRDGGLEPISEQPDLADDRIWVVTRGLRQELLVGTDGEGLKILDQGRVRSFSTEQGLPSKSVLALHLDGDGTVWAGTYGGGLVRLKDGRVDVFRAQDGLVDDVILGILEDGQGNLWLSSNKGVSRVAKSDLGAFAEGKLARVSSRLFGKTDGMRSAECNGAYQPSAWKSRDGRLWFPTIDGVVSVDPARLVTNPVAPNVVIEHADVDGRALDLSTPPMLAAGAKRLEITYTGLSFFDPEKVRFRYRLEGYDQDWLPVTSERKATYTNLPPGREYRFQLIAVNGDGVWSEEGAGFAFSVEPRFYQRPIILAAMAGLLALLSWSAFRLRVRQLVHRTQLLEAQVAERTAEVVAQRDQLSAANEELTRLNRFKSEFLGIAAHDLKNPLSVIYGYAGLLVGKGGSDPTLVRTARRIAASANQMLNIVSDLLDTTAIDSGKLRFEPQPTDLGELVTGVLEAHRVAATDRQIEMHFHEEGDVSARVDQEKMTRAVQNLVSNAIRYTRPSTRIDVFVTGLEAEARRRVRITVRDEGPGMSEEQLAQIFERFVRLAAKHNLPTPSTGLGLSIVKQFVEIHGGRVWAESKVGQGSTFHLEVPAEPPAASGL